MKLKIFDVGHGFCAHIRSDNGNDMLFDCGHDDEIGFRPSTYFPKLGIRSMEALFVSNYDADHVSDLANFRQNVFVKTMYQNGSISTAQLRKLKLQGGPLTGGMESLLAMKDEYIHPITDPIDYAGINFETFHNQYGVFADTNNLSMVTFVEHGGFGVLFTGDMEKPGWNELLKDPSFRAVLPKVSLFVASHHGRDNGYCEELFNYCKPWAVVISDTNIKYDSQKHCYNKHTKGIPWSEDDGSQTVRHVLTTRCDGDIEVTHQMNQNWNVSLDKKPRRSAIGA